MQSAKALKSSATCSTCNRPSTSRANVKNKFSVVRAAQQIEQAFFIVTGMGAQCIVTGLQIA